MPEGDGDHPPVGLARRLAAVFYDALIVFALIFIAAFVTVQLFGAPLDRTARSVLQLAAVIIAYGYFVGFWTHGGQTIGMRAWKFRLVDSADRPVGVSAATRRFLAAVLSWLCVGLGFLWALWDRDRCAWHDRLSRTHLRRWHPG